MNELELRSSSFLCLKAGDMKTSNVFTNMTLQMNEKKGERVRKVIGSVVFFSTSVFRLWVGCGKD